VVADELQFGRIAAIPHVKCLRFKKGPLFIAVFVLAGISLSFCSGPVIAVVQDIITPKARATALGILFFLSHLLGDAAAPSIIAYIAHKHSLGLVLAITSPTFLFLAGFVCLLGLRSVSRDMRHMQEQLQGEHE
jgi:MFS family permease